MCPTFETRGTLAIAGVFKPGAVSTLERDADLSEVLEAFLASQIPNKATQRGYRRHLRHAFALMAVETLAEIQPVHLQSFRGYLLAVPTPPSTPAPERNVQMPTDKQRLDKLARRMKWTQRECDGSQCTYATNMPYGIHGFKHPEADTIHPADFRAWIDLLPEPE